MVDDLVGIFYNKSMKQKQPKLVELSEHEIQSQIMDYLSREKIPHWRANVTRKYNTTFGLKGQGDITGILKDGRRLEIEVKDHKGKLSPEQIEFGDMIKRNNGVYILARSLDDVIRALDNVPELLKIKVWKK